MPEFTVLLLYPDYLGGSFGHETWLGTVPAANPAAAIAAAQAECGRGLDLNQPEDLHCHLVIAGRHTDLKP